MELNLEKSFVREYWKNKNHKFYQFLELISQSETWTLSDETYFQSTLQELCGVWNGQTLQYFSRYSTEITEVIQYMDIFQFSYFFSQLDNHYAGTSFHYVMEARSNKKIKHFAILYHRLCVIKEFSFLDHLFSPMRSKLISGILEEEPETQKTS